jgi:hypothetical protein
MASKVPRRCEGPKCIFIELSIVRKSSGVADEVDTDPRNRIMLFERFFFGAVPLLVCEPMT